MTTLISWTICLRRAGGWWLSLHITHAQRLAHRHSNTCQMNDWVQTVWRVQPVESCNREENGRSSVCGLRERGGLQCLPGFRLGIQRKNVGAWQVRLIMGSDHFPWRTCLEESDTFSDHLPRPGRRSQAGVRNVRWASHWDQVRWGYQRREWEACDREWGQGIYIMMILLRGKQ